MYPFYQYGIQFKQDTKMFVYQKVPRERKPTLRIQILFLISEVLVFIMASSVFIFKLFYRKTN